jgi:hypothetical protein
VPVRAKLLERPVTADIVQPPTLTFDATFVLQNDLRNPGRGCNSRRLHSPFPKLLSYGKLGQWVTRASFPPPAVPGVAQLRRRESKCSCDMGPHGFIRPAQALPFVNARASDVAIEVHPQRKERTFLFG